ncbi:MAG: MerR family transcriptional regulator [Fusobacteriaceae bacterium]
MEDYLINKCCTISEMAKILKVGKHTIIHYETEKLVLPVFRGENGYRYYSGEQISQFKKIFYLRELGFSINEIKEYLKKYDYSVALNHMKERLKKNQMEIDELIEKRKKLLEGESFLKNLTKIEKNKGTPYIQYCEEVEGVYLTQESFDLKPTIKNMKEIDNILEDITWTEKYSFGFIISKNNLQKGKIQPEKFVLATNISNFDNKYIFPASDYAVLYIESKDSHEDIIKNFFEWIESNNLKITGDLFIEDSTSNSISTKYNLSVRIYKISVKKS